jgi:hypothetical protein
MVGFDRASMGLRRIRNEAMGSLEFFRLSGDADYEG